MTLHLKSKDNQLSYHKSLSDNLNAKKLKNKYILNHFLVETQNDNKRELPFIFDPHYFNVKHNGYQGEYLINLFLKELDKDLFKKSEKSIKNYIYVLLTIKIIINNNISL